MLSFELASMDWCVYISSGGVVVIQKNFANQSGEGPGSSLHKPELNLNRTNPGPVNSQQNSFLLSQSAPESVPIASDTQSSGDCKPVKEEVSWGDFCEGYNTTWGIFSEDSSIVKSDLDASRESSNAEERFPLSNICLLQTATKYKMRSTQKC